MSENLEYIDLDDLSMGASIPDGQYDVKLIDLQAANSKAGDPMLKATFEVTSGPSKGLTYQGSYFLGVFTSGKKPWSPGVAQIKRDAVELDVLSKLPNPFPLDANKAKLAYHKAFKGLKMRLHIQDGQPSKKDGKVYKEFRLLRGATTVQDEVEAAEEIVY